MNKEEKRSNLETKRLNNYSKMLEDQQTHVEKVFPIVQAEETLNKY